MAALRAVCVCECVCVCGVCVCVCVECYSCSTINEVQVSVSIYRLLVMFSWISIIGFAKQSFVSSYS